MTASAKPRSSITSARMMYIDADLLVIDRGQPLRPEVVPLPSTVMLPSTATSRR